MINTERWSKAMNGSLNRSIFLGFPKYSKLCSSMVKMIIDEYIYYSFVKENKGIYDICKQWFIFKISTRNFELELYKYLSQFSNPEDGNSIINKEINKLKNTDLIGIGLSLEQLTP